RPFSFIRSTRVGRWAKRDKTENARRGRTGRWQRAFSRVGAAFAHGLRGTQFAGTQRCESDSARIGGQWLFLSVGPGRPREHAVQNPARRRQLSRSRLAVSTGRTAWTIADYRLERFSLDGCGLAWREAKRSSHL